MAKRKSKPRIEQRYPEELVAHPLQCLYYGLTTTEDDMALGEDLRRHGQRDAIQVMPPDNEAGLPALTILDGHRRRGLLMELEVETIDVIIRHDLADANATAVEAEFLRFNSLRRQLHPLDQARIAVRLIEIEKGTERDYLRPRDQEELRDRVGTVLGMSGRNLDRYLRLLRTPVEVQNAVRDGRLGLVEGGKVDGLTCGQQLEIGERIRDGEEPKTVVANYIHPTTKGVRMDALTRLHRVIELEIRELEESIDTIPEWRLSTLQPTFERVKKCIDQILKRCRE